MVVSNINSMSGHVNQKESQKNMLGKWSGLLTVSCPPSLLHGCVQGISDACSYEQLMCSQALSGKWLLRL